MPRGEALPLLFFMPSGSDPEKSYGAGGEGSIAVAPGIYVVKAEGKVEKVNVK